MLETQQNISEALPHFTRISATSGIYNDKYYKNHTIHFLGKDHLAFFEQYAVGLFNGDGHRLSFFYLLGMMSETRDHIDEYYNFGIKGIHPDRIYEAIVNDGTWSSSEKCILRLAIDLYKAEPFTPTFDETLSLSDALNDACKYDVFHIFCNADHDVAYCFWEAIKLAFKLR